MAQHRAGQAIMGHAMPNSKGSNASGKNRCGMWSRSRIITHGFTGGGYKNSSPWKNVNRTTHNNDTLSAIFFAFRLLFMNPTKVL